MKNFSGQPSLAAPPANNRFKFLFVTFLGIHIPLIGLISFVALRPGHLNSFTVIGCALFFTLLATAITLWILNRLLQSSQQGHQLNNTFSLRQILPQLPAQFSGKVGQQADEQTALPAA